MGVKVDLIGKRVGKLVVIQKLDDNYFLTLCDCGKTRNVPSHTLRGNRPSVQSCEDCIDRKEKNKRPANFVDRVGHVYGSLTVVEYLGHSMWNCICNCGNKRVVGLPFLLNGHRSFIACEDCCKRSKSEKSSKNNKDIKRNAPAKNRSNLVGRKFYRLLVTGVNHVSGKDKLWKVYWDCICDCGQKTIVHTGALQSGNTKSCGCLQGTEWGPLTHKQSFISYLRSLDLYKNWRLGVLKRDCYRCVACESSGKIDAHHVIYFRNIIQIFNVLPGDSYELAGCLWDQDNGVTLCRDCHRKVHSKEGKTLQGSILSKYLNRVSFLTTLYSAVIVSPQVNQDYPEFVELLRLLKLPYEVNYLISFLKETKQFYPKRKTNGLPSDEDIKLKLRQKESRPFRVTR